MHAPRRSRGRSVRGPQAIASRAAERQSSPRVSDRVAVPPGPKCHTPPVTWCMTKQSADHRIARLAARQAGTFSRSQALAVGMTDSSALRRIRSSRWIVLHPGVYLLAGAPPTWHTEIWARVLAAGPLTTVTHEYAVRIHGSPHVATRPITLSAPHGTHPRVRRCRHPPDRRPAGQSDHPDRRPSGQQSRSCRRRGHGHRGAPPVGAGARRPRVRPSHDLRGRRRGAGPGGAARQARGGGARSDARRAVRGGRALRQRARTGIVRGAGGRRPPGASATARAPGARRRRGPRRRGVRRLPPHHRGRRSPLAHPGRPPAPRP